MSLMSTSTIHVSKRTVCYIFLYWLTRTNLLVLRCDVTRSGVICWRTFCDCHQLSRLSFVQWQMGATYVSIKWGQLGYITLYGGPRISLRQPHGGSRLTFHRFPASTDFNDTFSSLILLEFYKANYKRQLCVSRLGIWRTFLRRMSLGVSFSCQRPISWAHYKTIFHSIGRS